VSDLHSYNIDGPPEDNIGGQRSKYDILATILYICLEGSLKNHIVGKGNFSDALTNHYLSVLLYHGLLEAPKIDGRNMYRTTEKGRKFVSHYNEIQTLFKKSPAPRHETTREEKGGEVAEIPSRAGKRILVVDDESDISSAIKIGLEDSGFAVDVFNDPHEALAGFKPGFHDLLIFDVKMPRMSGFELYREISKIDDKAKVCFLTAFEMYIEEFKRVFPSMNVKHFIQKPISMPDLVDQIRKLASGGGIS
jgi:CheY-like chemotaxis protein/predicted transcriptional regulator